MYTEMVGSKMSKLNAYFPHKEYNIMFLLGETASIQGQVPYIYILQLLNTCSMFVFKVIIVSLWNLPNLILYLKNYQLPLFTKLCSALSSACFYNLWRNQIYSLLNLSSANPTFTQDFLATRPQCFLSH